MNVTSYLNTWTPPRLDGNNQMNHQLKFVSRTSPSLVQSLLPRHLQPLDDTVLQSQHVHFLPSEHPLEGITSPPRRVSSLKSCRSDIFRSFKTNECINNNEKNKEPPDILPSQEKTLAYSTSSYLTTKWRSEVQWLETCSAVERELAYRTYGSNACPIQSLNPFSVTTFKRSKGDTEEFCGVVSSRPSVAGMLPPVAQGSSPSVVQGSSPLVTALVSKDGDFSATSPMNSEKLAATKLVESVVRHACLSPHESRATDGSAKNCWYSTSAGTPSPQTPKKFAMSTAKCIGPGDDNNCKKPELDITKLLEEKLTLYARDHKGKQADNAFRRLCQEYSKDITTAGLVNGSPIPSPPTLQAWKMALKAHEDPVTGRIEPRIGERLVGYLWNARAPFDPSIYTFTMQLWLTIPSFDSASGAMRFHRTLETKLQSGYDRHRFNEEATKIPQPNMKYYLVCLEALTRRGKLVEKADEAASLAERILVSKLRRLFDAKKSRWTGYKPESWAYFRVIHAYCNTEQAQRADDLLVQAERLTYSGQLDKGISLVTYGNVIAEWKRKEDCFARFSRIRELVRRRTAMKEYYASPLHVTSSKSTTVTPDQKNSKKNDCSRVPPSTC